MLTDAIKSNNRWNTPGHLYNGKTLLFQKTAGSFAALEYIVFCFEKSLLEHSCADRHENSKRDRALENLGPDDGSSVDS
jgi:hypothetical protein